MVAEPAATANYYNVIMVYVIAGFCGALLVTLIVMWPQKLGQLRKLTRKYELLRL